MDFIMQVSEEMTTSSCGSFGGFPGLIYQEKRQVMFPASNVFIQSD